MDQRLVQRVKLNVPSVAISCRRGILCTSTLQKRLTSAVECSYV